MNNKTIIIANDNQNSKQLATKLLNSIHLKKENLMLLQQKQPQWTLLNLNDLSVDDFLQLQQNKHAAYSIACINKNVKSNSIKLKVGDETKHISFEEIIRLEACSNYTRFHLSTQQQPILTSRTLKFYVDKLDNDLFVRPHHSHLVNRNFIDEVLIKPKQFLILKDAVKIPISRRRIGMFRN